MTRESVLSGQVAIVTGGGRGLGQAICHTLARAGASVIVADIDKEHAETTARALRGAGRRATAATVDVADERSVTDLLENADSRLDILVNCAGIDRTVSIEELSVADWDRILSVNLRGPFLMSRAALARMRPAARGHIVNIVSTAAKRAWANASAYHASKWGLLGFTHALHVEARPLGIKVTAMVCGGMCTPFLLDRFPDIDRTTLQAPENVAEAPLLVSNNTGPVHLAAALGTPVVDLYALTNPQHTPWRVSSRVLFQDVPCRYCYKSVCPKGHHRCLRGVSPGDVLAAIRSLMTEARSDAGMRSA